MNVVKSCKLVLAIAGLSIGCAAIAQDALWTPEEIKTNWVDKKLFLRAANGTLFDLFLKADGTLQLIGSSLSDTGTWRLSEKGYCTTWKKIRAGEERCFTVGTKGSSVHAFNPDGSSSGTILRTVE